MGVWASPSRGIVWLCRPGLQVNLLQQPNCQLSILLVCSIVSACARTHNTCRTSLLSPPPPPLPVWLDVLGPHLSILHRKDFEKTRVWFMNFTQPIKLAGPDKCGSSKQLSRLARTRCLKAWNLAVKEPKTNAAMTLLHTSVCVRCWKHAAALGRVHHFFKSSVNDHKKKNGKHVLWGKEQNYWIRNEPKEKSEKQN